jgi:hypothetical protein
MLAPRARLMLEIAGRSSGLSPTESAMAKSRVSIGGLPSSTWPTNTSSAMVSITLVSR